MKRLFLCCGLLLLSVAAFGQACTNDGTGNLCAPVAKGNWMLLNHDADDSSGDEGCYSSDTVGFATNAMTITLSKPTTAPTCGNGDGHTQGSEPYLSGSVVSVNSFTPGSCSGNASCISCPSGTCTIQAKIKAARGWPAFWLLGGNGLTSSSTGCQYQSVYNSWDNVGHCNWNQDSGTSGDSAEIDIMEMNEQGGYTGSTQNLFSNGTSNQASVSGLTDATQNYHVWTLHWSPSSLTYAQDGTASSAHWTSNVPQNPMFIILENTVGVGTGAQPPNTALPSTMTTQYVQVCDGSTCTAGNGVSGGNTIFLDNFTPPPGTYYVSKSGNDSNNCTTSGTACLTIGAAIGKATTPGSTVQVGAGTYAENITLSNAGTSGNPITVRGQDGTGCPTTAVSDVNHPTGARPNSVVTITGNATIAASYNNLDCFHFSGTSAGITVNTGVSHFQITNNEIQGTTALGTNAQGIFMQGVGTIAAASYPSSGTITGNYIHQSLGIFAACSGCVYSENEITNLQGSESGTSSSGNDHDYMDIWGIGTIVRHNYMYGNTINSCDNYDCHMDCVQTWDNSGDGTEISQNITFDRNVCFNHHEGVIAQDNSDTGEVANWTVTNNVFAYGPWDDGSGHPGPAGSAHSWCWVFENGNMGTSNYFENNTCIDGAEGFRSNAGSAVYKDNLFYSLGTDTFMYDNSASTVTGANNMYYAVSQAFGSGTFTGDIINVNPKLVSVGTGSASQQCVGCNFSLQATSPAKDAGVNTSPQVTVDLLGVSRPQGAAYDIGAYEGSASPPPTIPTGLVSPGVALQ